MNIKQIWKFPLKATDIQTVKMPIGAEILSVQIQNRTPCIWALVDPGAEIKQRHFIIFGTGHNVPEANQKFIGTVQCGALVFHVFEIFGFIQSSNQNN